jgi:arginase family enzyme
MSAIGKVFGVALDASDDPFSLQLKQAAMQAREMGIDDFFTDPYDALLHELIRSTGLEPAGRFPVPSWLGSLPIPSDRDLVTAEAMQRFVDGGGIVDMIHDVRSFVTNRIMPAIPVMLGIDHAATGGVVSALSECVGADNLTVIVLDRHFDALPLSARIAAFAAAGAPGSQGMMPLSDAVCCGNFWAHLIDRRIVEPKRLAFLGVADYPAEEVPEEWAVFRRSYLAFEEQGCRFMPLAAFGDGYEERLRGFLNQAITTPYVYVSLDLDVGSYNAIRAARYMDGVGISIDQLLTVARIIAEGRREGRYILSGLDVVEFNMHLLGLRMENGEQDHTARTAVEFIKALVET